ncbi:HAD-IIA family hydrolase [Actinomyces slackii]|uniref:UMP phosphatase n=1 Tax=Actinomyces slackii TaxID=52774 RepID=A0A3S4SIL1_9ACTO|nr:HAD-IIA family hydrolase [Actinomyces slackii]VEG73442.1 UMP phosphatase [Actinomyces slackii]
MSAAPTDLTAWPTRLHDAYVFDMDGTIYLGDDLLPGAKRLVVELRRRGLPVRFLSNNPTKDPDQYAEKLARLGLETPVEEIANTVVVMTRWLLANRPGATVFPIAEEPLIRAFAQAGIPMSDNPEEIDVVVASYDRGFDYRKLQIAFDAIWYHRRATLVATNPDRFCPFPQGRGEPDCAAITAAIEACTQTPCEVVVGKPNPIMLTAALGDLDLDPAGAIMVGDRLSTDIQMAVRTGMHSAMPLTGESTLEEALALDPAERPTHVLDRIDRLIPAELWHELGWTEDNDPVI